MPDFGIMRGFGSKLFSDKLVAGQLPTQLGLIGSLDIAPPILDVYPNAAAAYSVRKLRTAYTGSAIRVRRSSDNAEQNIGFVDNVNRDLDTAALIAFCGSGNGFVTTWYDQSGNGRNVTQTTAASQPQIVSSGAVINVNSKPSIRFQDANDYLRRQSSSITSTSNTMVTVSKFNTNAIGVIMSIGNTVGACYTHLGWVSPYQRAIYSSSFQSVDGLFTQNQEIWGSTTATSSVKFWYNGTSQTITNSTQTYTANLGDIQIGNDDFSSTAYPNIQEAIYWNTTQSDSNLIGINTNQNTYYAVY